MSTPMLEIKNIKKKYKDVFAVQGISFEIDSGKCFGLLGPNGAGKTTTLEMIEGIRDADEGEVYFSGSPRRKEFFEHIGIQTQSTETFEKLTVIESLKTFKSFYKKTEDHGTITLCQLEDLLGRKVSELSGGQKQRVYLALALINQPTLLFLDEPTTGLDPQSRRHLWEIIKSIKASGKTIVLTTHYLEEAYQLCDEIAIMDHGKILVRRIPTKLLQHYFKRCYSRNSALRFAARIYFR